MNDGSEHDIDDLSSGEKELVYGYLRLRNLAPRRSILLLDEPELHLNPRIIRGLPSFYRKNLGIDLENQLWMVTHSDAFLRDAFQDGGFSIYHMKPWAVATNAGNQAVLVSAKNEVHRLIFELVGDIAGFDPQNRVVICEGGGGTKFDASLIQRLFPDLTAHINLISGDDRGTVQRLYGALRDAVTAVGFPVRVFAIIDKDTDAAGPRDDGAHVQAWDVYHIENYLLEPEFIAKVLRDNPSFDDQMSAGDVRLALAQCAEQTMPKLIEHELRLFVNASIRECLDLGYDRSSFSPWKGLREAVGRVRVRLEVASEGVLAQASLQAKQDELEVSFERALREDRWWSEFRGRDILKDFVGRHARGLPYDAFRDAIVARMADAGYQPVGMKRVLDAITSAEPESMTRI